MVMVVQLVMIVALHLEHHGSTVTLLNLRVKLLKWVSVIQGSLEVLSWNKYNWLHIDNCSVHNSTEHISIATIFWSTNVCKKSPLTASIKILLWIIIWMSACTVTMWNAIIWIYLSCDYRAAVCDVICFEALALVGGKTMERLFGNGRKLTSFLLTSPISVIEHLQY